MLNYQDATNVSAKGIPSTVRTVFAVDLSTSPPLVEILRVFDRMATPGDHKIDSHPSCADPFNREVPGEVKGSEREDREKTKVAWPVVQP